MKKPELTEVARAQSSSEIQAETDFVVDYDETAQYRQALPAAG